MELIAHRAGNAVDSLRRAQTSASMVEVDLHWSRRRLEVRHAKVLWPTRRLWERWHLLPSHTAVPELDDILAAAEPGTHLMLDLKGVSPRVAREVLLALGHRRPVTASSKAWWVLAPLRGTGVRTVRSAGNRLELALLLWAPFGRGVDGVGVHHRLLSRTVVARLRRRTPVVLSWGVADHATARLLAAWGVTGLIVDDEGLLQRLAAGDA